MATKTVFITGCGPGGIGAALAKEFHRRGHIVIASGRTAAETDPSLATRGIRTVELDVTSDSSIAAAVRAVQDANADSGPGGGGVALDILVNNAGLLHVGPLADTPAADVRRVLDVNVVGVWAVTRAFLPLLVAQAAQSPSRQAVVANLASVNEHLCPPFLAAYNASKAAVMAMTRTARRELAPLGVRVVAIKTGGVTTALFENAAPTTLPLGSWYEPLRGYIEGRGFQAAGTYISAEEYAKGVVDELTKRDVKAVIWRGGMVWLTRFLYWFGWDTLPVSFPRERPPNYVGSNTSSGPRDDQREWTSQNCATEDSVTR